jgi:hypothetical protein
MPELGQSRSNCAIGGMSGLRPPATELRTSLVVRFAPTSGSHSILIATGEHWLQRSFGQPGSPQSSSVSRKIFGTPKRAYHVFEIGNT